MMQVGKPDRSMTADRSIVASFGSGALSDFGASAISPPSLQATSAGTINVAIWPGAVRAAVIASTASLPASMTLVDVRTHLENGFAIASMSEVSGAS
jgi:hypothetical protein